MINDFEDIKGLNNQEDESKPNKSQNSGYKMMKYSDFSEKNSKSGNMSVEKLFSLQLKSVSSLFNL